MSKHKKQPYVQAKPTKQGGGYLSRFVMFVGVIAFINASCFCGAGFFRLQSRWDQTEWTATTAQVVEVTQGDRSNQTSAPTVARYEYQANGTTYQGTDSQAASDISVGTTIPIRYDPENPEVSTTQMNLDLGFLIQASIASLVAIACLYGPSLYQKRRNNTQHRLPVR